MTKFVPAIKNFFNSFVSPIKENGFFKKTLLSSIVLFSSFLICFPVCGLNSSANIEDSAAYYSEVVLHQTQNKTYLPLIAECKDNNVQCPDTEYEFYNLYGSFRESKSVFAATANADKSHSVIFDEINNVDINYSFLFVERAGFSNQRYKGAWKHEFYPLQLEFRGNHDVSRDFYSFVYISESDADLLLKNPIYHDCKKHEDLLGKSVTLTIDGVKNVWMISNIYLQTNYFYDSLTDVMGNFFLTYNKFPETVNKQSLFFLREHSFQNQFYLNYAKQYYSREDYFFKIGSFNLNNGFKINEHKLEQVFLQKNEIPFYLLYCLQISVFIFSLFLVYRFKIHRYPISLLAIFVFSSLPYFIFKVAFFLSHSTILFTSLATETNMFQILVLTVFVAALIFGDLFRKGLIKDVKN